MKDFSGTKDLIGKQANDSSYGKYVDPGLRPPCLLPQASHDWSRMSL